jgi:hypothetical protein
MLEMISDVEKRRDRKGSYVSLVPLLSIWSILSILNNPLLLM